MKVKIGKLDKKEILRYLGIKHNTSKENTVSLDEKLDADIDLCEKMILEVATPRIVFKENDAEIIFAATLGSEVDRLISKNEISNMRLALILDAIANAAIENVCDEFEKNICEKMSKKFLHQKRFSPGYGDFPLSAQEKIIDYLDAKKTIGLALTSGGMLTPLKSVTAVIRKTDDDASSRGCDGCNMKKTCMFRREGEN